MSKIQNNKRQCKTALGVVLILSICILFKDSIEQIINTMIVNPVFSTWVDNNRLITTISLFVLILVLYILLRTTKSSDSLITNHALIYFATVLLYFRVFGDYDYLGFDSIKYIDVAMIEVVLMDCIYVTIHFIQGRRKNKHNLSVIPFYIDNPTAKDDFCRRHMAKTIIQKIIATDNTDKESNAMTILLSETYGVGKSSFFKIIEEELDEKHKNICCFYFKPWLCDSPELMTANFFNLLKEKMGIDNYKLGKMLKNYADTFSGKPYGNVIKSIFNHWDKESLENQHDKISNILRKGKIKYLVLIDDVDRLQYKELVELIRVIRNAADFPNVFYLVAADKDAIMHSLRVNGNIENPELYLQKFFNYELLLPAYEQDSLDNILCADIESLLSNYSFTEIKRDEIERAVTGKIFDIHDVFRNPREIKRYLNLLSTELDALNVEVKNKDGDTAKLNDKYIYIQDLLKLILIKYLQPDVYKTLRDNNAGFMISMISPSKQLIIAADKRHFFQDGFHKRNMLGKTHDYEFIDYEGSEYQNKDNEEQTNSFKDIIDSYIPTKESVVKELFVELWSENRTIDDKPTINKNDEFFKYFAGRFRNNEVTFFEVESFIKKPVENNVDSSSEFIDWFKYSISKNKIESIIDKALRLDLPYENRYDAIVNVFTCIRLHYEYEILNNNKYKLSDSYDEWAEVLKRMLRQNINSRVPMAFYENFKSYIASVTNYEECALFMEQVYNYKYWETKKQGGLVSCIFSREQYDDYSVILINRAFRDRVMNNPYSIDTFNLHSYIKRSNPKYWHKTLSEYIHKSDNPMEWLYGTLYWDDHYKMFYWNLFMCYCIYNAMELSDSIETIMGDIIPDDYKDTLHKLPTPFENQGNGISDNDSRLFKDIKRWQKEGNNHFPHNDYYYL